MQYSPFHCTALTSIFVIKMYHLRAITLLYLATFCSKLHINSELLCRDPDLGGTYESAPSMKYLMLGGADDPSKVFDINALVVVMTGFRYSINVQGLGNILVAYPAAYFYAVFAGTHVSKYLNASNPLAVGE